MRSSMRSWFSSREAQLRTAPGALARLEPHTRRDSPRTVGVLVYQGVTTAEVSEPVARLAETYDATVQHIGISVGAIFGIEPAREVAVDLDIGEALVPDILVLPGGIGWQRLVNDQDVMLWVNYAARHAKGVLASSTGSLILAAAGRLQGQAATGHWLARRELSELGADVQVARIVKTNDGRIVTTSGAQSALSAAAALGERIRWGSG